jgi:hypothetical protein
MVMVRMAMRGVVSTTIVKLIMVMRGAGSGVGIGGEE